MSEDPFDRAVAHERRLRRPPFDIRSAMKIGVIATITVVVAWAGLVALHFRLFPEPRWLAITHLIVYALFLGSTIIGGFFSAIFIKKNPGILEDVEEPP